MINIKKNIQHHPISSYFTLVFLIAWGGSIAGGWAQFHQGKVLDLIDIIPMALAMLIAPIFGGIVMTYTCDGKNGIQDLISRMTNWNVGIRWYAVLFIFPILILITLVPLSIWVTPELKPTFFPIGILMGLLAGFIEEIGWMGFVYPKMRLKLSALQASIFLGFLHALWHLAADFLGNYQAFGKNWLPYFAGFIVFIVALRVLIAWVYENTKSLLLAQLIHASSSGFLGILVPLSNTGLSWVIFYAVYAFALWVFASIIIIRHTTHLREQPTFVKANKTSG